LDQVRELTNAKLSTNKTYLEVAMSDGRVLRMQMSHAGTNATKASEHLGYVDRVLLLLLLNDLQQAAAVAILQQH
jgi:hypothetical protein